MKAQVINTHFSADKEALAIVFTPVRNKIISIADVWNIQRNKRARVQRRFAL